MRGWVCVLRINPLPVEADTVGGALWPPGVEPTADFLATLDFVRNTGDNLFVTGRAGTGKSTLLRALVRALNDQVVIGAPTGIAAFNVGGQTLHSLFRLPREGLLLDGEEDEVSPRDIFEAEDLTLIIDEVSMVRSDVLNAIDHGLRQQRERDAPFGGVRVIAFGDTHQLPPVITNGQGVRLHDAFGGTFFFHAPAAHSMTMVELTEVFRQKDPRFVAILNQVREGDISDAALAELNARVSTVPREDDHRWVWLCTTNKEAADVNRRCLDALPGEARIYHANVSGEFEALARRRRSDGGGALPAEAELVLKVGARVVFIRNDWHRRWVNGTTGVVTRLDEDEIDVTTDVGEELTVGFDTWTTYRRVKVDKEVRREEAGSMSQLPLRLGWAITIHKSQGMTLESVVFNAPRSLFAPGQAYVGLSRARSLDRLLLRRALRRKDILLSPDAVGYRSLLLPLSSRKRT
jgi:ATP-dependent exoDNAse (exonuclease V) alpha subunit